MVNEIDIKKRKIGVNFNDNQAHILVWSPLAEQVNLVIDELGVKIPLAKQAKGYWSLTTDELKVGEHYSFELEGEKNTERFPDPASLNQSDGVHLSSQAFDLTDFPFNDQHWKAPALENFIIYELHTGTFTPDGTFYGIEQKLAYLVDLGITAIEIMPVAQFPGNRNWGYDGVFPFAVQNSYGGALGLQNLINVCHQKGLAVILDVVYNHFGPEGNYFSAFAPYFTEKYQTPWGSAINFDDADCDGVRHFFVENVLMWFRDFHVDALRLDAVHAIKDLSPQHILAEIREKVDELSSHTGKTYQLIVECDLNDRKFLDPVTKNGYGMQAQWTDEFHHALRVTAGQERHGYYADFNGISHLVKAYQDAYVYDGFYSEERKKTFGTSTEGISGDKFVVFSQNHDQVGNRPLGERTSTLHSFELQKLLAAAVMISPFVPLLFMGEEYGETNPFFYFISHSDKKLIAAVQNGRKEEFKAFHLDQEIPDPQDEKTFLGSRLQWELPDQNQHQALFQYYKTLIALRKKNPVLCKLNRKNLKAAAIESKNCLILERWNENEKLLCILNFSKQEQQIDVLGLSHSWSKIFDSSSVKTDSLPAQKITVQAESILIYTNSHV